MSLLLLPIAVMVSAVLLGLYIWATKRHYLSSLFLCLALICCAAVELFDFLALRQPKDFFFWKRGSLIFESLLPFLWLAYALFFSRQGGFQKLSVFSRVALILALSFPPIAVLAPQENFFFSPDFPREKLIFLGNFGFFFYIGLLLLFIFALANMERSLLALPSLEKWRAKFEIIGAGVILVTFILSCKSFKRAIRIFIFSTLPERVPSKSVWKSGSSIKSLALGAVMSNTDTRFFKS